MIQIKDEHIKQAQDIFIDGNKFDDEERIPFIKNLETCDLLAVPGSGKTTALMAKLYCISQNMPFGDGSGILVLAHTNQALDEIEKKLKKHCPQLFEFPNFIGTIQSFTNRFLANQACFEKYGSYIKKNNDDLYESEVKKFFYSELKWDNENNPNNEKRLKNKLYGKANYQRTGISPPEKTINTINFINDLEFDILNKKFVFGNKKTTLYKFGGSANDYYLELESWKEKLYKFGLLNYKDSFNLGNYYLSSNPQVKLILQKRFKYVFIDEMQDLEKFQINLIDNIFYLESSTTIIQRIGDINQSIYNSGKKIKDNCDWEPRNPIYLTGSNRLTEDIANFVNYFTLDPQPDKDGNKRFIVKGLSQIDNPIKPHLIIFNKESKGKLQSKFEELIKSFNLHQTINAKKDGFHIVSWSTEWNNDEQNPDNEKIRLKDIFPNYSRESKQKKEDFNCFRKHLQLFDSDKKTLEGIRKSILNALIRILREEKIYKDVISNIYFRKRGLIDFIKNIGDEEYKDFKLKLFNWCFKIVTKNECEDVYQEIKKYVENEFINYNWNNERIRVPRAIDKSSAFLNGNFKYLSLANEEDENKITENNEIKIKTSSIHSIKGQTHCATMYIESSYYNYETEKLSITVKGTKNKPDTQLPNPLFGEYHTYRLGKDSRAKEALKMMYVGFSRPTHLLCFATLEENVKDDIEKYKKAGWIVINDLINSK
jgi:DNA helicase-2/ATP-dependent DNA helicase PcrA